MVSTAVDLRALARDETLACPQDRARTVVIYNIAATEQDRMRHLLSEITTFRCEPRFASDGDNLAAMLGELDVLLLIVDVTDLAPGQLRAIAQMAARHPRLQQCPVLFLFESGLETDLIESSRLCQAVYMRKSQPPALVLANLETLFINILRAEEVEAMRLLLADTVEQTRNEMDVAKRILDNIASSSAHEVPHVRIHLQPMERLNGDMALVQKTPAGKEQILVGDFTGHGLTAAVGGMIAADTFNAMTLKGYCIADIAAQINRKLNRILPTGLYMAACLVEWDLAAGVMAIWNGGLPEVLLRHGNQPALRRLRDGHPPLGILPPAEFSASVRRVSISPGDRAYIFSDGLIEMRNPRQEMWGMSGLLAVLNSGHDEEQTFDEMLRRVSAFRGEEPLHDDVTLVELICPDGSTTLDHTDITTPITARLELGVQRIVTTTSLSLRLDGSAIAAADPVPSVMQLLGNLNISEKDRSDVFVILRELVSNAIDHGLLELNSDMKTTTDGFNEYYRLREERLAALRQGYIDLRIDREQEPDDGYDALRIRVEDSGAGFDHRRLLAKSTEQTLQSEAMSGRGVSLLRLMCREFKYNDAGNAIEVVYRLGRRAR